MPKASFTPFQPHNLTFSACLAIREKGTACTWRIYLFRFTQQHTGLSLRWCPKIPGLPNNCDWQLMGCFYGACFLCLVTRCVLFRRSLKLCPEPPSTVVQFQDVELQADQLVVVGNWDDKTVAHGFGTPRWLKSLLFCRAFTEAGENARWVAKLILLNWYFNIVTIDIRTLWGHLKIGQREICRMVEKSHCLVLMSLTYDIQWEEPAWCPP